MDVEARTDEEARRLLADVRDLYRRAFFKDRVLFGYLDPHRAFRNADRPVADILRDQHAEIRGGETQGGSK